MNVQICMIKWEILDSLMDIFIGIVMNILNFLKSNLPAMNDTFTDIQLTSSYSEPRNRITYCTDNITISYDAGDVTVTLCNGPFDEGYYDKIEIKWSKKNNH